MKKYLLILGVAALLALPELQAQRIVSVSPGVGTLNDAIDGDTTATGERVDLNTIYELQDGGVYKLTRSIENRGKGSNTDPYPLHIRAEAGSQVKPFLQPTVPSGGSSDRAFRINDHLTIEGLHVTNEDDLGALIDQTLRITADNVRLIVRDCFLEKDAQTTLRCDGANPKIYFTNTTVAFMGTPADMDNGRFIDPRNSDIDSVVVEQCVIYGVTSRYFRDGGGTYNYVKVNQSTFANSGQRAFHFGDIRQLDFTNSIIMNGAFLGRGIGGGRALFELSELDAPDTSIIRISNNNYFVSSDMEAEYAADPTREAPMFFDSLTNAFNPSALTATNFIEIIDFKNGLGSLVPIWTEFTISGYNASNVNAPWDMDGAPHRFFYTAEDGPVSIGGGTDGRPVGAGVFATSIDRAALAKLGLRAYPNPATDLLTLENKMLRRWSRVTLVDLAGRTMKSFPAFEGESMTLPVSDLAPGVYLLLLTEDSTQQRSVVRFVRSSVW